MTFSSFPFLFMFLPIVFALYFVCRNDLVRNILLVIASLFFYAFGEPTAVIIMIASIILNYLFGRLAAGEKTAKPAVVMAVAANIGMLAVFKYSGFFAETFNSITHLGIPVPQIRLPIGISFFTFQGLSYVIDVYRDKSLEQKSLLKMALFISLFPQLIAGPIVKYNEISGQLGHREFSSERVTKGITRFIIGLGKKVLISNNMGLFVDKAFAESPKDLSCLTSWIAALCYMLQIYYDFSGYSDMAIGLGCMFGFDFMENFNYPYISGSVQEFWRRWHISLSTWFKNYVYIPLGGNRVSKGRTILNRCIVFFLTGFWHGANFTFIVWGMLHGAFLLLEEVGIIPTKKNWFKPLGHIYTVLVAMLTFVIFRANTLTQAGRILGNMFTGAHGDRAVNVSLMTTLEPVFFIALAVAVIFSAPILPKLRDRLMKSKAAAVCDYAGHIAVLGIFALCILSLVSSSYNPFIYFRF
ncbi:alginate O-acetyltransferase complex protein AlgI [Ruminococcus sp. YE71]|uniref:MBOAT family O-acyltransferase n=1 Tax=unclassified Ruminococcus TaxID=2608920 RepID=UPI00089053E2|nr:MULTISPECIES: MBOAT family protein [unclassified Ruminococcus]SDA27713.1 alginate O-acetyltransferase complex protein AlgI [Ruminococcus sp. YE78]SFW45977.1 alginate O-acetyltransferase complex protein AlgI [Ruminococcus sp. YE71]